MFLKSVQDRAQLRGTFLNWIGAAQSPSLDAAKFASHVTSARRSEVRIAPVFSPDMPDDTRWTCKYDRSRENNNDCWSNVYIHASPKHGDVVCMLENQGVNHFTTSTEVSSMLLSPKAIRSHSLMDRVLISVQPFSIVTNSTNKSTFKHVRISFNMRMNSVDKLTTLV